MHLTDQQLGAIRRARNLGRRLRDELPEIAEEYRAGAEFGDIVERHDIVATYGETEEVSRQAIHYVLHGAKRFGSQRGFRGLLRVAELREIRRQKRVRLGRRTYEEGRALFAATEEERFHHRSLGGQALRDRGEGLFGMSAEERREIARRAGRLQYERGTGVSTARPSSGPRTVSWRAATPRSLGASCPGWSRGSRRSSATSPNSTSFGCWPTIPTTSCQEESAVRSWLEHSIGSSTAGGPRAP